MKYIITEELVNQIASTLHELNVGSKTLASIIEALKKVPEVKPEVAEVIV